MEVLPKNSTNLELSISIPGLSSSSYFPSSGRSGVGRGGGGVMKGFDINQTPVEGEEDCMEEDDEISNGGPPRKKLRLTKEQSLLLEESFRLNHTLNPKQKEVLAMQLGLKPRQVEVWFQNRRARSKLKQTETECEYLKRWFGSLSEQNRRLHKEVEELRAMKVGPPTVLSPHTSQPLPASTLSMCPRCERVTTTHALLDHKGHTKTQQPTVSTTTTTTTTSSTTPTNMAAAATLHFLQARHRSAAC